MKAFPAELKRSPDEYDRGMDLRDYFAIHCPEQANTMTWADVKEELGLPPAMDIAHFTHEMTLLYKAKKRYAFADAMIEARAIK